MTPRQIEYQNAISVFFKENDQLPTCLALAEMLGTTNNAAAEMLGRLEKMGVIGRNSLGKYKRGRNWRESAKN